ncbi:hypothetical protein E2C01_098560 [Portunus trituberculatus]|uniref:Uncharacterized protein n=1 Tax=Portunus trituberculatus TaxID=210409 RepID=A0A5B7K1I6_PORTR|nr:hypothetical protein [Portunus trituberculatus]
MGWEMMGVMMGVEEG